MDHTGLKEIRHPPSRSSIPRNWIGVLRLGGTLSILVNITSKKAICKADSVESDLQRAGWHTIRASRSPGESVETVAARVSGSEALVVVGGDGTVRMMADVAKHLDIPIWQVGAGNENLFARSLGMKSDCDSLLAALEKKSVHYLDRIDVGDESGLLMVSTGFDAQVIEQVANNRSGSVNNLSYVLPVLRVLTGWKPSRLTIRIDGEETVVSRKGWVVIANSPDYGGRFDPVPGALMDDSMLDVLFVPMRGSLDAIGWIVRCRLGLARRDSRLSGGRRVITWRGQNVEVQAEPGSHWQLDGDPLDPDLIQDGLLSARVDSRAIPVLLPADADRPLRALQLDQADPE